MEPQISPKPKSEKLSPSPTSLAAYMPTSTDSASSTNNAYLLRGTTMMPFVFFSPSSSTLAAKRAKCRPQIPPGKVDNQGSVNCRHDHPPAQSYKQSFTPPLTAREMVSPTVIAARDYYLNRQSIIDTPPQSGSEIGTPQCKSSFPLQAATQFSGTPRRHSVAIEPYLVGFDQMNDLKLRALEAWRRGSATPVSYREDTNQNICTSRVTRNRERWMQKVFHDDNDTPAHSPSLSPRSMSAELLELPTETERQIHNPLEPRYLGNIPFSYTTNKLREWGDVYLFNFATADAFIRAIPISPPYGQSSPLLTLHRSLSNFSLNGEDIKVEDVKVSKPPPVTKQVVKVKVVPQCRSRKSFFMQKEFPISKPATSQSHRISKHSPPPRHHLRHHHEGHQGTKVQALRNAITGAQRRPAIPIHIEYALYRTPLLAAVLLCEHVKRGDTIEIPLPFPEAWEDVIEWVYTGKTGAGVSTKVRETVEYLGGKI